MKDYFSTSSYTRFLENNGFHFEPFTIQNSIWRKGNLIVFVSVLETVTMFEVIQGFEKAELNLEVFLTFECTY